MQLAAPQVVDFSDEPKHVLDLYGIGDKDTDDFGRQLLLARRLAEQGVRFIQICHAGGGNGSWDAHGDIKTHEPLCRATDKPIAGLIRDLKQRGMLDADAGGLDQRVRPQPLVAEHHRPRSQSHAATPSGWPAAASRAASSTAPPTRSATRRSRTAHYYSDLHATILQQLGLDYKKMELAVLGRTMRLVEEGDGPIKEILS